MTRARRPLTTLVTISYIRGVVYRRGIPLSAEDCMRYHHCSSIAALIALSCLALPAGAQGRGGAAAKPDYSAPAGAPYTAEDVTVTTPMGHTLAGTLTMPKSASRTRPVGAI